ncbi:MAG: glutamate-5-semialdehyde dehydrogenase [Microthrixaceae bacterium]|nr:glutamate-5-semialdehyde dehydrogenase [Microthrixaceae bacterium]
MPVTPIPELARRAKAASRRLATASTALKDEALLTAADLLEARSADVLAANSLDVAGAEGAGIPAGLVDRLRLTEDRVAAMASGLRQVAALADPVGEVLDGWVRPNGLRISRVRVPLGVVGIIYESRPNVTSDAAGLSLTSGTAAVLREAVAKAGLPEDSVIVVEDTSRDAAVEFMQQEGLVDCLIPRGGASLIASIKQHATVPFVIDGDGNCHVYVDAAADLDMAETIVLNAKTQRPSVCNAAESLVVHAQVAAQILPRLDTALADVELVGDARARALVPRMGEATDEDYAREFLDMRMSVRVVDTLDEAIEHVNRHSTGHSEAIVTTDVTAAERFLNEVDAAAVLLNASTRFVDGEEFGFGAEIGISTQKLHARGPMGLQQLTTAKYVVRGDGQTRG